MSLIKNLRARVWAFQHALDAEAHAVQKVALVEARAAARAADTIAAAAVKGANARLELLNTKVAAALSNGQKNLATALLSAEPGIKSAADAAVTALVKDVLDSLA